MCSAIKFNEFDYERYYCDSKSFSLSLLLYVNCTRQVERVHQFFEI